MNTGDSDSWPPSKNASLSLRACLSKLLRRVSDMEGVPPPVPASFSADTWMPGDVVDAVVAEAEGLYAGGATRVDVEDAVGVLHQARELSEIVEENI